MEVFLNQVTNVKNLTEQLSLVVGVMFNQEAQVMELSALFTSNTKYKLYTKVMPARWSDLVMFF